MSEKITVCIFCRQHVNNNVVCIISPFPPCISKIQKVKERLVGKSAPDGRARTILVLSKGRILNVAGDDKGPKDCPIIRHKRGKPSLVLIDDI